MTSERHRQDSQRGPMTFGSPCLQPRRLCITCTFIELICSSPPSESKPATVWATTSHSRRTRRPVEHKSSVSKKHIEISHLNRAHPIRPQTHESLESCLLTFRESTAFNERVGRCLAGEFSVELHKGKHITPESETHSTRQSLIP